jgi:hypothetical protein
VNNFMTFIAFITQNQQLKITSTITIPMIQYINKESPYHCSFPKSIYPNQQSYNPYVHPNGDDCVSWLRSSEGMRERERERRKEVLPLTFFFFCRVLV